MEIQEAANPQCAICSGVAAWGWSTALLAQVKQRHEATSMISDGLRIKLFLHLHCEKQAGVEAGMT